MNYILFNKARVNAETGLISVAIQMHADQEAEDEVLNDPEIKELEEIQRREEESGEALSDFQRGN